MLSIEKTEEADSNWNQRLLNANLGSIQQTKEYGVSKKLVGGEPLFLKFISQNGAIVGQLLVVLYPRFEGRRSIGQMIKKISVKKATLAKWVYGPLVFDNEYKSELIKKLQEFIISQKLKVWGSEFPLQQSLFTESNSLKLEKWGTFLINLNTKKENAWNSLDKHSAKKNIERAKERNVIVKEITKSDLSLYYQLGKEYGKSNPVVTPSFLEEQWDILHPAGYSGFMAFENDVPVGAIRVSSFNGYINEFSIIRSERDKSAKLYSQDLLKWKIIEWGIENKFRFYDLSGVNPKPTDDKEKGIFRYKQKWGGDFVEYGIIQN